MSIKNAMSWSGLDLDKIFKDLKDLERTEVLVGIPEDKTSRPQQKITNAALGYIHENGSPAKNIPARPWLVPGILDQEDRICGYLKNGANEALDGDYNSATNELEKAGTVARDAAKAKINSNIQPGLSERTLAARRKRGVTRTNTLIDTGSMRNSVNYVLKKK